MAERPLGLTAICMLGFLGAILGILGGIALFGLGKLFGGLIGGTFGGILGTVSSIVSVMILIISVISLFTFYGLWKMEEWAWKWTMLAEIISIFLGLFSLNPTIFIPVIIVIYLWMQKDIFK
jgi:hypothetical protein